MRLRACMLPAMARPALVVLNPASRNGATGQRWREIEPRVRRVLGDLEVAPTQCPRDAVRIAREGAESGVERFLVAGGDGTAGEVVTGLLDSGRSAGCAVGLMPLGTGGDLTRGLGVPRELEAALERLAHGKPLRVDAGRVRYTAPDGRPTQAGFVNVASLGMSGLVTRLVNDAPKLLGGRASFLLGTLRALLRWQGLPVRLVLDGETVHEGPLHLATAANGQYFGGGMRVAPRARMDDGLLDVVAIPGLPKHELLRRLPLLYSGAHVDLPQVRSLRGRVLEAEALDGEAWTEIDGEPLGTLPARYEVVPGAITLLGAGG